MERRTLTRWYDLHSWTGVWAGLFVFLVCCSGTVALFKEDLKMWEQSGARYILEDAGSAHDALMAGVRYAEERMTSDQHIDHLLVMNPLPTRPYYEITFHILGDSGETFIGPLMVKPGTNEVLSSVGYGFAQFHRDFHTNLVMPGRVGRYLVGISGLIMLISVGTGIFMHRHMIKEFFVFRPGRSVRLLWTDFHKIMGLWGLVFHGMISFTGALLGLVGVFLAILAFAVFDGDQEAATEALFGTHPEATGVMAPLENVDGMIADATAAESNWYARGVFIEHFGDENAIVSIFGRTTDRLSDGDRFTYIGSTGELHSRSAFEASIGGRIYGAVSPLHYATYGGYFIKLLYVVLGASSAALAVTGMLLWVTRREQEAASQQSGATYGKLRALIAGIGGGQLVAIAGSFWGNLMLPDRDHMYWQIGSVFFALWAVSVLWAFVRQDDRRSWLDLLGVSGLLFVGIAPLNALLTGDHLVGTLMQGQWPVALVDLTTFCVGLVLLTSAWRLKLRIDAGKAVVGDRSSHMPVAAD